MTVGLSVDGMAMDSLSRGTRQLRLLGLVLAPVVVIAVTVFATSSIQQAAEQHAFDRVQHSEQLLAVWLARSDAVRTYLQTGSRSALARFDDLAVSFQAALQPQRTDTRGVPEAGPWLTTETQSAELWRRVGAAAAAYIGQHGVRPLPLSISKPRSDASAAFQTANDRISSIMRGRRNRDITNASSLADIIDVMLVLALAIAALLVASASRRQEKRRTDSQLAAEVDRAARERRYADARRHFSQVLLASDTEAEACQLISNSIESQVSGSSVSVLRCNNSADRLEAVAGCREQSALATALHGATPRSCLAIRLGRSYRVDGSEPVSLRCELCGGGSANTTCEALIVGTEVIGSVQIAHTTSLADEHRRVIDDTIALGTPALANLRNLALAQRNAHTDALTGLPNRRAMDDMFTLMLAQAGRTATTLSVILIDLDGFKGINDTFGHARGDDLLSTVAGTLARSIRAGDFVARIGGDEFLALLPDTDLSGAGRVAENIAEAIRQTRLAGFNFQITATLGIAGYPEHGLDTDAVIHSADIALYQAKQDGRNCIRIAPPPEQDARRPPSQQDFVAVIP